MFLATPFIPDSAPLTRTTSHRSGRIVWQQRYNGIARVAYRGGRAIAGISGPWSDRYALIWWDERPPATHPLELFETAEAAMRAVEERIGRALPKAAVPGESRRKPRRDWLARLWTRNRDSRIAELRRDSLDAEIDLNGLNFNASR
ncbi:MAG TPA: hypothetical protein VLS52_03330 [Rudaea sp.]|nr:hypothetical protein [Rudaea sp.]